MLKIKYNKILFMIIIGTIMGSCGCIKLGQSKTPEYNYRIIIDYKDDNCYELIIPFPENSNISDYIFKNLKSNNDIENCEIIHNNYGLGLRIISNKSLVIESNYITNKYFFSELSMGIDMNNSNNKITSIFFKDNSTYNNSLNINIKFIIKDKVGGSYTENTNPTDQTIYNIGWQEIIISKKTLKL